MKEIMKALRAHFGGYGIPVWRGNEVPAGTALPVMTLEYTPAAFPDKGWAVIKAWFDGERSAADRDDFVEWVLKTAAPSSGELVACGEGWLLVEAPVRYLLGPEKDLQTAELKLPVRLFTEDE